MNRIFVVFIFFLIASCSNETPSESMETEQKVDEPVFALDVVNVEIVSESPEGQPKSKIIYNDKLYAVYSGDKTYMYDFNTNIWNLVRDIDIDLERANVIFGYHTNFIKNEKWYLLSNSGLLEYDFGSNDWTTIISFPLSNSRFHTTGFFKDDNVYFVDIANGNSNIYKYDYESSEVSIIGTYENPGNSGWLSNNIFEIEGSYYFSQLLSNSIRFSKFSSDFKNLETLNEIHDISGAELADGVSWVYEDKIIFGLGGDIVVESDGRTVSREKYNRQLFVYDTKANEFFTLESTPFEESFISAEAFSYNNAYYLFGGRTVSNNQVVDKTTMYKLTFEVVQKQP